MATTREARERIWGLGALAAGATAAFAALNTAVARRDTAAADQALRKRTALPRQHAARELASAVSPAGKWWSYLPAALGSSAYLLVAPGSQGAGARRSRRAAAGAVLLTGAVAAALPSAFDRWLPQPPAPPGHRSRRKPVFPSGHAFGPGAVSLATAYLLAREGLARPRWSVPLALCVPLATASGRVLEEKHWASDLLGGYLAGTAVAALCLLVYEASRTTLQPALRPES